MERIGDGDQDTYAQVRLGSFDPLQEGQVNTGSFGERFLCQLLL